MKRISRTETRRAQSSKQNFEQKLTKETKKKSLVKKSTAISDSMRSLSSADRAIRERFCFLDDQDQLRQLRLNEVRTKIQTGLDQLARGEGITGKRVYSQMKRRSIEFRKIGQRTMS